MCEMKNEADGFSTKRKNEDLFKELDKDRIEKKCEYAVLVSLLEPDSELYSGGIVDVMNSRLALQEILSYHPKSFIQRLMRSISRSRGYGRPKMRCAVPSATLDSRTTKLKM